MQSDTPGWIGICMWSRGKLHFVFLFSSCLEENIWNWIPNLSKRMNGLIFRQCQAQTCFRCFLWRLKTLQIWAGWGIVSSPWNSQRLWVNFISAHTTTECRKWIMGSKAHKQRRIWSHGASLLVLCWVGTHTESLSKESFWPSWD